MLHENSSIISTFYSTEARSARHRHHLGSYEYDSRDTEAKRPLDEKSGHVVKKIGQLLNKQIQEEMREQIYDKVHENIIEPVGEILE